MSISRWLAAGGVLGSIAIGVALSAAPNDVTPTVKKVAPTTKKQTATAENNKVFHAELLKIAAGYKAYGRVDDDVHWKPTYCRGPMPARARFSKSDETDTHGEKLYYLYANDRTAYLSVATGAKPKAGQVIVKESWHPKETTPKLSKDTWKDTKHDPATVIKLDPKLSKDGKREPDPVAEFNPKLAPFGFPFTNKDNKTYSGSYYPYAKKGDKFYHADKLAGLFIMYKADAKTPGTDKGWVYGTVTADGKTVTSAGRVASCMACHEDAPHGRLFGLKGK